MANCPRLRTGAAGFFFPRWSVKRRSLEEIAAIVRDFRKDLGLTQKQLAAKAGIDSRTIWRVEQGNKFKVFINVYTLMAICEALDLSADGLLWEDS